jgi:hypothetical protein
VKQAVVVTKKIKEAVKPRLAFGLGHVLDRSEAVARAFGPRLGFVLMLTAVLAASGVSAGTVIVLAKGLGRVLG